MFNCCLAGGLTPKMVEVRVGDQIPLYDRKRYYGEYIYAHSTDLCYIDYSCGKSSGEQKNIIFQSF